MCCSQQSLPSGDSAFLQKILNAPEFVITGVGHENELCYGVILFTNLLSLANLVGGSN